jgi:integrase
LRKKITESLIKTLKPPERGNRIVYDTEIPGHGVRITANHAVSFILEYSLRGRQRRYTIGPWPALTATAAREKAQQLRTAIANKGIDPLAEREELRSAPTVADLADRYIEDYARPNKAESSLYQDLSLLSQRIRPELGKIRVTDLVRDDIERLQQKLRDTPYRANRVLSLLSKMFALAVEWKLRPDNPCQKVQRYPEQKREAWLRIEDIERLNATLDLHSDRRAASAIKLLLLTGARRGELLKARWSEFDLDRGVWTKPSLHTKQKKTEFLPLSSAALALLKVMKQEAAGEFLFPGKDGAPLKQIDWSWIAVRRAAGITDTRLHDLRHTYASHLVTKGVSLHVVGRLLGHTKVETTMRYAHIADEALRAATGQFGAIVEKFEPGEPADVIPLKRA